MALKFEELNAFATRLKAQRRESQARPKAVHEAAAEYLPDWPVEAPIPLFTEDKLQRLQTVLNV